MVSEICDAFTCTPDQALTQDWDLVSAVLDYRTAKAAVETFTGKNQKHAFDTLEAHPELAEMLAKMQRAQLGEPVEDATVAEGQAIAKAQQDAG